MASTRLDVSSAVLAVPSQKEILLSIPAAIPSSVCRFARHLRFVGATDTGSPERNLEAYRAQVCVSRLSQKEQIHGERACFLAENRPLTKKFYCVSRAKCLQRYSRSFLRSDKFLLQNCAILCNTMRKRNDELPSISNDTQSSETLRNSLVLN